MAPRRIGESFISQSNETRSRENATASSAVGISDVVGKLTSTGKYKPWDPNATDGTQVIAGVAYSGAATNQKFVLLARECEVKAAKLHYPAGQLAAVKAGLLALQIIVR